MTISTAPKEFVGLLARAKEILGEAQDIPSHLREVLFLEAAILAHEESINKELEKDIVGQTILKESKKANPLQVYTLLADQLEVKLKLSALILSMHQMEDNKNG
jgi:hypothetical protein